ncbi:MULTISPECIES: hypothetical protein [Citrobacter freundii complex]|uniref:hypothetical protein n=1 Tax=Citrobacter freundii complex TaxID=1344959 RepID=UPI000650E1E4|nr:MULTISPECIES: hypothetical protein [Citrobacter freundii complex]KLV73480.1 hypothetical protein SK38_01964 [Citrobacter sp. MGH110]MEB1052216.1 hypothetical protein [Citrobacter portucalensis]
MKFFKAGDNPEDFVKVTLTSSTSSSNFGTPSSKSDTNVQTALLVRADIEEMIKNHRPKTEKEIRAEGDNLIRFISMIFIFLVILTIFVIIIYFGVSDRKLPDFANNLMALMTTLVGGIGGFIYGTKK